MKKGVIAALLIVFSNAGFFKAQVSLEGRVVNAAGEGVPFALVNIQKTQLATVTDEQGAYKFEKIRGGKLLLHVKCIGYLEKTDTIEVQGAIVHDVKLAESAGSLDEVVVNATRVDKGSGMAFSNIDKETLQKQNLGQDAPFVLNQLPSVVVNSDAGNGIGYTGLRIRGTDGTRINVTINGVPVNDAESQGTFFVDMPDFVSGVNNIQVQRGVGASSNGAGAFGATINFQTNELNAKPYANIISGGGSFNTIRNTIAAGTGLLNGKFTLDARASSISSDGYVDRASSDLKAYYLAAGYYGKKFVLKYINFRGWEKTYQAWNLVPEDSIKKGNRTYNENGIYYDESGAMKYYQNQTDNYDQDNHQLHFIQQLNSRLNYNATAYYTKGKGYYEEYKEDQDFISYQLKQPLIFGSDSNQIMSTDLIRRKWLDNDLLGGIFNLNYTATSRLAFTLGGGYSSYFGRHFDKVIWAQYAPDALDHKYSGNNATKNDGNIYLKSSFRPSADLSFFVDLQVRNVDHRFFGLNSALESVMQTQSYFFFNPKAGISYNLGSRVNLYASIARANKEPNRNDFIQSTPGSRPRHEQLTDIEAGIKYAAGNLFAGMNLYNMQYTDQLVLNGKVNDVGAYNRVNVKDSYRRGIELEAVYQVMKQLSLGGNLTLSENKISSFTEYIDSSDVDYTIYTQYSKDYKNTHIAYSPDIVGSLVVSIRPLKGLEFSITGKQVGRQYLDNTSDVNRSIDPFQVMDLRLNYTVKTRVVPEIGFNFAIYNVLDARYETNGYTYSYYEGPQLKTFNYLAPAAPTNFLGSISLKF